MVLTLLLSGVAQPLTNSPAAASRRKNNQLRIKSAF